MIRKSNRLRTQTLAFAILVAGVAQAQAPKLTGTIVDTARRPLPDVTFTLFGGAEVKSDSAGNFRLNDVPVGSVIFKVTRIGFAPVMKVLQTREGDSLHLDIMMRSAATELEAMRIRASAYTPETDRTGFERRSKTGMGQYLSTDRILRSHSFDAQNLVRTLTGVVVDNGGVVHVNRGVTTLVGTPCKGVQVLVDGVAMSEGFDIRLIPIESIRGIEFYSGAATVPAELKASRSNCGTLAVWTW